MAEDYQTTNNVMELDLTNMLVKDLNELLNLNGKKMKILISHLYPPNTIDGDAIPSLIKEELAVDIPNEDIESVAKLNNYQMIAFKTIMNVIIQKHNGVFFVDATASSRIAATLFPGGRTAHSRFKIPIDIQLSSIYGIQKQKDLANLIRFVATIIWDETPMTNKKSLEALDRSFQDICSNSAPFGGKVLIMGGDFGQVLPVVRKEFEECLIRIGDGVEPTKPDDMVRLPS
ncbi:ATP-dependent DNA helicase RRM3-like [Lathyrus oleraceus]|uniref:ATP-dependent DNA helicase RRM3-like n=1 Tax=Pisum sativum TaxID=3888 RepID=UPI0021D032FF|nr:ATP-dependent DNA helicase RRM3-like [Pisum sativum]